MIMETNLIRKIIVSAGDRDISYVVGKDMAGGNITVADIVFDQAYALQFNEPRYNIYVIDNKEEVTRMWKSVPGNKCVPEYDLNIQKEL
tara:strand:- start:276 stop:542 length:267 start_codon:yes stop_codon:yes gene_type:complete